DSETANILNRSFVSIKVDREERPDVDAVYMNAVETMTGRGGWPMTVFLTPDLKPFFAGTYFPKDGRFGLPSFQQVLAAVAREWNNDNEGLLTRSSAIAKALDELSAVNHAASPITEGTITAAADQLRGFVDLNMGGVKGAPKFPMSPAISLCIRIAAER